MIKVGSRWRSRAGFSMAELLVAVAVVVMVLVAVAAGVAISVRNSRFSKEKALSVRYAQEGMEWLRNQRDSLGWRAFVAVIEEDGGVGVKYCLSNLPSDANGFRALLPSESGCGSGQSFDEVNYLREVDLNVAPGGMEVEAVMTVRWEGGSGESTTVLESRLRQWR